MNAFSKFLSLIMFGNTTGGPSVWRFPFFDKYGDLTVIKMPQDYTARTCKRLGSKKNDDGTLIAGEGPDGCYDYTTGTMWLSNLLDAPHELCHRQNPPTWNGKEWVYANDCSSVLTPRRAFGDY
jgi:hypothetical protein